MPNVSNQWTYFFLLHPHSSSLREPNWPEFGSLSSNPVSLTLELHRKDKECTVHGPEYRQALLFVKIDRWGLTCPVFPIYLMHFKATFWQGLSEHKRLPLWKTLTVVLIISACFVMSLSNFWDVVWGPATCLTNLRLCICWLTRLSPLKATVHVCGPEVTGGFWIDHVIGLGSYVSQDPRHSRLSKPRQLGLRSDDSMSSSPHHASAGILPCALDIFQDWRRPWLIKGWL